MGRGERHSYSVSGTYYRGVQTFPTKYNKKKEKKRKEVEEGKGGEKQVKTLGIGAAVSAFWNRWR